MKQKLWKAIEAYRISGGREEHWRNRDVLDILLDEVLEENARVLAANRDVMLHFDALKQDYDMLVNRQQEPVAWLFTNVQSGSIEASTDPDDKQGEREYWHKEPLYTSPPARKPLTDDELKEMFGSGINGKVFCEIARMTEAAHDIK